MKRTAHRLVLLALSAAVVVSCDTRLAPASRKVQAGTPPTVLIDSPVVNSQINLGDSILVRTQITGGNGLKTLVIRADALTGDADLGTFQQTPRFNPVTVTFPNGVTDTTIRRYLKALNPGDATLDSLLLVAVATDSVGLTDSSTVRATLVSGPHVTIESPAANDSVPFGVGISISAHATDADGIAQISIHVVGDPTWPTRLDTIVTQTYDGSSRDVIFSATVLIPANATPRSRITVNASSIDAVRQPGSAAPLGLFVRSAGSIAAPRVTQVVPTAAERRDTIIITATGQGIAAVGLVVRDSAGNLVDRDSVLLPAPFTSNIHIGFPLRLNIAQQGRHLAITAFAVDQVGRTGYAVRSSFAGSETVLNAALSDSSTIVYGETFTMPLQGTIGDIAIDEGRGNVILSNTPNNRLDVWQNSTHSFDPNGIAVGSRPWGMTISATNSDTLLVANSGGTNISRVFIGSSTVSALREDLPHRILTRNMYVFNVIESKDVNTGKITLTASNPISYSDRPQYLAQASTGRIYFSTMPTSAAPDGTIRWIDPNPAFAAPDPQMIYQYGGYDQSTTSSYVVFNVDSVKIAVAPVNSLASDVLFLYDHIKGSTSATTLVGSASTVTGAIAGLGGQSDALSVLRLNTGTLGLTDTTFVASSGDRHWIAFGEGNTGGRAGRIMITADSLAAGPSFFSPLVTVSDLGENAAEVVFGLALDKFGKTVASHGLQSYFAEVDDPFHLRLQGKYDSFDNGAGIALHPDADGRNSPASTRLAFVASSSGAVEIVDIAYFINRGKLQLKYPIYGNIRVTKPMPGDDPSVILKLFALTQRGLIVVDLTAADIKAGPP